MALVVVTTGWGQKDVYIYEAMNFIQRTKAVDVLDTVVTIPKQQVLCS